MHWLCAIKQKVILSDSGVIYIPKTTSGANSSAQLIQVKIDQETTEHQQAAMKMEVLTRNQYQATHYDLVGTNKVTGKQNIKIAFRLSGYNLKYVFFCSVSVEVICVLTIPFKYPLSNCAQYICMYSIYYPFSVGVNIIYKVGLLVDSMWCVSPLPI